MSKEINFNEIDSWSDLNSDQDLFKQITEDTPIQSKTDSEELVTESKTEEYIKSQEDQKSDTKSKNEDTQKETEEDFFDDESEITSEDIKNSDEKQEHSYSRETLNYLLDNDFISRNDDFDFDTASENDINNYIRENLDASVDQHIDVVLNDLPDFVKQLNKYVINGGDYNDYIQYYNSSKSMQEFNIDNPESQKQLISNTLQQQGFGEDYIHAQLEFLESTDRLEMTAKEQYKVYQKQLQEEQEALYKQQIQQIQEQKEKEKEYRNEINQQLVSLNTIGDLNISKNDRNTLSNFITDRKIKLENGQYITELQKQLFYDIPQNIEAMLQLAILVKNRNSDGTFNFDNIKRDAQTKITKEIKDNLRRTKSIIPDDTKDKRQYTRKTIADYFD